MRAGGEAGGWVRERCGSALGDCTGGCTALGSFALEGGMMCREGLWFPMQMRGVWYLGERGGEALCAGYGGRVLECVGLGAGPLRRTGGGKEGGFAGGGDGHGEASWDVGAVLRVVFWATGVADVGGMRMWSRLRRIRERT